MTWIKFLQDDLWRIRLSKAPWHKRLWVNVLRVVMTAAMRFQIDRCGLMASALTFYSLLSIVPVLAAAFGIAKGFGFQDFLQEELLTRFDDQKEVIGRAIEFAQKMLEQTKGGVIAGVGVVFLLWSVTRLLSYIESSFNFIWRVARARSIGRTFSDYLAMIIIGPLLFVISSSVTVYLSSQLEMVVSTTYTIKLLPYLLIWFLFTFTYMFVPNTKVTLAAGLVAGIVAGSTYQVWQWAYIYFQISVASYGAIYGSFAALPLFLIWLQFSWLIVLAGAQIAAAMQNLRDYEFRKDTSDVSLHLRGLLGLLICHRQIMQFKAGNEPLTNMEISNELEIPIRLTRELTAELVKARVLRPVQREKEDIIGYAPARDIQDLTICSVIQAIHNSGSSNVPVSETTTLRKLEAALQSFSERCSSSKENQRIDQL